MDDAYDLYVPAPGVVHDVRPGSAIVGRPLDDGMIDTHYEGGGASNVTTFEECIGQAAGRRRERYPTTARRTWHAGEVLRVGSVTVDTVLRRWVIDRIDDETALRIWIGGGEAVPGGSRKLRDKIAGRSWGKIPAERRARILAMRLNGSALSEQVLAEVALMNTATD